LKVGVVGVEAMMTFQKVSTCVRLEDSIVCIALTVLPDLEVLPPAAAPLGFLRGGPLNEGPPLIPS